MPFPDDQVILKADGFPTYHLAVVVDDHLMGINTVVRGEEWISSTPKHLLLLDWLGFERPLFAHMPLLRNPDKSKISKRKNPAARLAWFREQGYLPEAVRNFLQLLAYPPVDDDHEVSTFEEFIEHFRWDKVNTVGPIFDMKKLDWLNGVYIRQISADELTERIMAHMVESGQWPDASEQVRTQIRRAVPLIQERMTLLNEAVPMLEFLFVQTEDLAYAEDGLAQLKPDAPSVLQVATAALEQLPDWTTDAIHEILNHELVQGLGIKPKFAFTPLRVAVTGKRISPPLFESMELLGRETSLARLRRLADHLAANGAAAEAPASDGPAQG